MKPLDTPCASDFLNWWSITFELSGVFVSVIMDNNIGTFGTKVKDVSF